MGTKVKAAASIDAKTADTAAPASAARKTYKLLKPHMHGGRERPKDTEIDLTDDQATTLRAAGRIK